jgi:hypothetical protein
MLVTPMGNNYLDENAKIANGRSAMWKVIFFFNPSLASMRCE